MSPNSSGVRSDAWTLLFLGGIMGLTWWDAILKRRLSPLRLGTTTFPDSPPLRMSWGDSRISSALVVVLLWHARQLFFRMGRISFSKSTGVFRSILAMGIGFRWASGGGLSSAINSNENNPMIAMRMKLFVTRVMSATAT